jgi:quercetin dioxygenase-like cupin family protein
MLGAMATEGAEGAKRIELDSLPGTETARRFEGHEHGSTTSFFVTEHPPGRGPDLHRHPYDEAFVVRSGRARFTAGEETIEAEPGQVVIVPANTWHGFKAAGERNLEWCASTRPSGWSRRSSRADARGRTGRCSWPRLRCR